MTTPIVFLDIEADSLHPGRRAWEVAMIRRDDDGERETSFFVALNLQNSDPKALEIGRFFDRHPVGRKLSGKDFSPADQCEVFGHHDAAKKVMQWTFGATIVGAVPNFDTEALARLLRAEGYLPAWNHRLRCVETLAAGFVGREIGGLVDCARYLGIDVDQSVVHTALGDARLARAIYDKTMRVAA